MADDQLFFFQLYESHKREKAKGAIACQVLTGMVESLIMIRRKRVQGSGAMPKLSLQWNKKTRKEKVAYKEVFLVAASKNIEAAPSLNDPTGLKAQSRSLKQAPTQIVNWLTEWQEKAVHVAARNHWALDFVAQMYTADGMNNYQSRLQAFLTGARLNDIPAAMAKPQPKRGMSTRSFSLVIFMLMPHFTRIFAWLMAGDHAMQECCRKLIELVGQRNSHNSDLLVTRSKKTKWSWQGCDDALAKLGYKVIFLPGALTWPKWVKTYSSGLHKLDAITIIDKIDRGLIKVVQDAEVMLACSRMAKKPTEKGPALKMSMMPRKMLIVVPKSTRLSTTAMLWRVRIVALTVVVMQPPEVHPFKVHHPVSVSALPPNV
ncbi:hypothetical protein PSTG_08280 [Puccinia striiformis f. sp. tritici PST-78]|uniref:Uncharacterized protein n=1 Tax=Puccinia striiformis f. sp. tritici PST-78 TaxID=1165861 RepID=A0A0L0VH53_9BASI|nr:hypothetical protein PSTG_08280 [Puccinia striiformis f. sp. tritici PST-78]